MAKIFLRYKIENAQPKYVPGMNISGRVWVENQGDKDKKLKKLEARIMEYYEVYESRKSGKVRTTQWWPEGKVLSKYPIAQKAPFPVGATLEYEFDINLPGWQPKHEKYYRNWWLGLFFVQKTGLMATGGARPLDATFIIPCDGATAPMSIIQGVIGGVSRSAVEGAASIAPGAPGGAPSMDLGYAESLAHQAVSRMETSDAIGTSTIQRLESIFPKNDELILRALVRVGVDLGAGMSNHWSSPVIASRHGMAYISPAKGNWSFEFVPWIQIKKLKKGVKFGSSLDQVSGEIFFKRKRGIFGRIFFKLIKEGNEDRSSFKSRKNEFRNLIPDLYNSAKKNELWAEPVEMVFQGAGGVGDPISVSGPPSDSTPQSTDADLFPGFTQQKTSAPAQSFNFESTPSSQAEESFDEEWDDDWFEEESPTPTQAQPAPPKTDFLPSQKPSTNDSKSEEWDWDDWED